MKPASPDRQILCGDGKIMKMLQYEGKIVRVIDTDGRAFTGIPVACPPEYGYHEYGREEESIRLHDYQLFESDIAEIRELPSFAVIRATETWQQAGAYYVRIQAMAKKHHIPLRQEFDEHDGPDTRYIVVLDSGFPTATARMYPLDGERMMIGRVVVLPEYRHQGIGTMVVAACEQWAEELCCSKAVVESRENKVGFYEQMLYEVCGEVKEGDQFRCVRMEKDL
jgi:predicted GNAT family N-acyltransferase